MKYALVDTNKIVVGPRDYHQHFFKEYLDNNSVSFDLPILYDEKNPIVVTDTISIIPVEDPSTPALLPVTEQLAGPYWSITPELITGYYDVADVPLDAAKNTMKSIIADARYKKETSTIKVTIQNTEVSIPTNRGFDRDIWVQSLLLIGDDSTKLFKFPFEGLWLELTKSDVQTIVDAIQEHVQEAFVWERGQVAVLDNADKTDINTLYDAVNPKAPVVKK